MKLPRRSALTFLLALLSSTGPLSLDMYLPSLPDIGRSLEASTLQVQLTISSYLFGSAVGQIFYGPISDRYGRRSPLLAALLLYALATFGCAAAQSIGALVALRFVQAIGVAGVMVMARAMVRDIYSGAHASRELSMMGAVSGFVPVIAPVIGGALQIWFGWRASFALLVLFGAVMGLLVAWRLPETLRHRTKMPFSLLEMSTLYRSVAAHQGFLANLAILTVGLAGLFAWLSGTPIVMQSAIYGLSPFEFGATLAIGSAGYILATLVAARTVIRFGLDRTVGIGTACMALGGLMMAAVVGLASPHVSWFVGAMMPYFVGLAFAVPASRAGALNPFRDRAATAASLMGFTQQMGAAIAATVVGFYLGQSAWPIASFVAVMGCMSFLIWLATRKVRAAR